MSCEVRSEQKQLVFKSGFLHGLSEGPSECSLRSEQPSQSSSGQAQIFVHNFFGTFFAGPPQLPKVHIARPLGR